VIPGSTLTPQDLLKLVKRWPQVLVPFLLVTTVTVLVVRWLPDQFTSETLILVVPQRVPESYVRSTVSTQISDRLQSISQQIMSRTRLEPIIREFQLYPELVRDGLMEDVVDRMRKDIVAQVVRGDAFRISYTSNNPLTAMKVTERLASLYINENLRDLTVRVVSPAHLQHEFAIRFQAGPAWAVRQSLQQRVDLRLIKHQPSTFVTTSSRIHMPVLAAKRSPRSGSFMPTRRWAATSANSTWRPAPRTRTSCVAKMRWTSSSPPSAYRNWVHGKT